MTIRNKYITKLNQKVNVNTCKIGVFDIETVNYNSRLYPYAIGILIDDNLKIFYIKDYFNGDFIIASNKMVKAFIEYINNTNKSCTLYAHNMGNFDGYLILKDIIAKIPDILIDDQNTIITMSFKNKNGVKIEFKDSYRILPASLKELSIIFDIDYKKQEFNHELVTIGLIIENRMFQGHRFKTSVINYLKHDLLSLHEILLKVSKYLLTSYKISLLDCFSTSSMAMKIYRTMFMGPEEIPILPRFYDKILRKTYMGGIVNVIIPKGDNLFYYDVNSLYPSVMNKAMPGQMIKHHIGQFDLTTFFGFVYAQIEVPKHINHPYACYRTETGELITPVGKWVGLYFSEELKAYQSWGYTVKVIHGYEHEKIYPFKRYVDHFYNIKKVVKGGERLITKLLLNGLYGFFGRKPVDDITHVIHNAELDWYIKRYPTQYHTFEGMDYSVIKRDYYPSKSTCKTFGIDYEELLMKSIKDIPPTISNVGIASAITSYARIEIHNKIEETESNVYYMDTDSFITDQEIPNSFVSNELGDLKNEFAHDPILEAYFVAAKVYGLKLQSGNSHIRAKSVPRSQLNFKDIKNLYNGEVLSIPVKRLFKELRTLSIIEKNFNIKLSRDNSNSKRINVFNTKLEWIHTKPIIVNNRMTFYEYLLHKGYHIPKDKFRNIITFNRSDDD